MARATPINSWKGIIEEIGHKPSPKEWEKYGIPEGTPYKIAVVQRLYHAIIEENAYHLLPKLFEYSEPTTKQIDVNVTNWVQRFDQLNVPIEIVAERLQYALQQVVAARLPEIIDNEPEPSQQRTDYPISLPLSEPPATPGITQKYTSGRPDSWDGDAEYSGGQEEGQAPLGADAETADAGGDTGV